MARRLDHSIMSKLARKLRKQKLSAINVRVSQKAAKLGVSAEAALVVLAKEHGIGTAVFQRKLDSAKQAEIRHALAADLVSSRRKVRNASGNDAARRRSTISQKVALRLVIDQYLIQDPTLRSRCQDILLAPSNFDRPINQATERTAARCSEKRRLAQHWSGRQGRGLTFCISTGSVGASSM